MFYFWQQFPDVNSSFEIIDQFWCIEIQQMIDLNTWLWGINPTNSVVIAQSLALRSIVLGWILTYWNWSIQKQRNYLYVPGNSKSLQHIKRKLNCNKWYFCQSAKMAFPGTELSCCFVGKEWDLQRHSRCLWHCKRHPARGK